MLPWIRQFRSGFRRKAISARPVRINERIRIREVRLIDEDGAQLGVLATRDALEIARERGLDLVEVQPNAVPPVCRLMDYGRFRYEESRRERDSRKKAKGATLKEVRLAPKIGAHDLQTKARQAQKFLEEGDKVKVSVLFRGREMLHQEIGRGLLDKVLAQLQPYGSVDQDARMEGRAMSIFMSPKPVARPATPAVVEATDDDSDSDAGAVAPAPKTVAVAPDASVVAPAAETNTEVQASAPEAKRDVKAPTPNVSANTTPAEAKADTTAPMSDTRAVAKPVEQELVAAPVTRAKAKVTAAAPEPTA